MIPVSCLAINHLICLPLPPGSPLPSHLDRAQGRHLLPPTPLDSHHQNRRSSLVYVPVPSHPSNHLCCRRTSHTPSHLLNREEDRLTSRPNNPFTIHRNNRGSDHRQDHQPSRDLDPVGSPPRCQPSMEKLVVYPPSTSLRRTPASNSYALGSLSCTCNAGYTETGFGISLRCQPCPAGYYTATVGAANCSICPAGSYAPSEGSATCSMCRAGYVSPVDGSSSCSPCDPGYFSSSVGSTACVSAPPRGPLPAPDTRSATREPTTRSLLKPSACPALSSRHHDRLLRFSICQRLCESHGQLRHGEEESSSQFMILVL
jgi:hypothetical protein